MAEREPKTQVETEPNLLENPGAFYDRTMQVFNTPEEKQTEEKEKLFAWLKEQWKAVDEKISHVPMKMNTLSRSFKVSKEIEITEESAISGYTSEIYLTRQKSDNDFVRIAFIVNNSFKYRTFVGCTYLDIKSEGQKTDEKEVHIDLEKGNLLFIDQTIVKRRI